MAASGDDATKGRRRMHRELVVNNSQGAEPPKRSHIGRRGGSLAGADGEDTASEASAVIFSSIFASKLSVQLCSV